MADQIDVANDLMASEVARALRKLQQNTAQGTRPGAKFCIECGEGVPEERQKMGFKFCVPCAEEKERRQSLYADD